MTQEPLTDTTGRPVAESNGNGSAPATASEAPAPRTPVRELRDGQHVEGVYAVRERELRRKRNGDPWLRLVDRKSVV